MLSCWQGPHADTSTQTTQTSLHINMLHISNTEDSFHMDYMKTVFECYDTVIKNKDVSAYEHVGVQYDPLNPIDWTFSSLLFGRSNYCCRQAKKIKNKKKILQNSSQKSFSCRWFLGLTQEWVSLMDDALLIQSASACPWFYFFFYCKQAGVLVSKKKKNSFHPAIWGQLDLHLKQQKDVSSVFLCRQQPSRCGYLSHITYQPLYQSPEQVQKRKPAWIQVYVWSFSASSHTKHKSSGDTLTRLPLC